VRPASYNNDTLPVSGRDDGPARPCARSQGRGCARPASEGSLDESTSRLEGMRPTALDNDRCRWYRRRPPPRAPWREAKGADAPARRLRAALISHHQGPMIMTLQNRSIPIDSSGLLVRWAGGGAGRAGASSGARDLLFSRPLFALRTRRESRIGGERGWQRIGSDKWKVFPGSRPTTSNPTTPSARPSIRPRWNGLG